MSRDMTVNICIAIFNFSIYPEIVQQLEIFLVFMSNGFMEHISTH